MARKSIGQFTVTREWAKHLRKWGKKAFWSTERTRAKRNLEKSLDQPKDFFKFNKSRC